MITTPANAPPRMVQVYQEKRELDEKLGKLSIFLQFGDCGDISINELGLLCEQERAMRDYSRILGERIRLWENRTPGFNGA